MDSLLLSGFGAAAGVGAVLWLARNWVLERLRLSIKHEYDEKLSILEAQIDQTKSIQSAATTLFAASHMEAHSRRLDAMQELWSHLIEFRDRTEGIIWVLDSSRGGGACQRGWTNLSRSL